MSHFAFRLIRAVGTIRSGDCNCIDCAFSHHFIYISAFSMTMTIDSGWKRDLCTRESILGLPFNAMCLSLLNGGRNEWKEENESLEEDSTTPVRLPSSQIDNNCVIHTQQLTRKMCRIILAQYTSTLFSRGECIAWTQYVRLRKQISTTTATQGTWDRR